jgi:hypothetical protein
LSSAPSADSRHRLRVIDVLMCGQLMQVDPGIDPFRLTLQSAAAERNSDKLKLNRSRF